MVQVLYKGRKRLVHIGKNGGKYVIVEGTKRYLRPKTKQAKKKPTKTKPAKKKPTKTKPAKKKTTKTKMKGGINQTGHLGDYNYNNPYPNSTNNRSNNNTARAASTSSVHNIMTRQPGETDNAYESRLASMSAELQQKADASAAAADAAEREAKNKASKLAYLSEIGRKVRYISKSRGEEPGEIKSINGKIITVKLNRGGLLRKINSNDPEQLAKILI